MAIGGPNRAGKTSFTQVLRYVGYGIQKDQNIVKDNDIPLTNH